MKYTVLIRQILTDGTEPTGAYVYDTREDALSRFHQELASAYANDNMLKCIVYLVNDDGFMMNCEIVDKTSNNI